MSTLAAATWERCRICRARLRADQGDDVVLGACSDCKGRPEAQRLRVATNGRPPAPATSSSTPTTPLSDAERSLVRAMYGYLPALELVRILNERRVADVGAGAVLVTPDQLMAEIGGLAVVRHDDWSALRQLLGQAREHGLLEQLTPQVLEDFAVVWQLSVAQLTHLRDVVSNARAVR